MTTTSYATDLTDRHWQIIKDLLPATKKRGRPRTTCLRSALNAMLYLLKTGCPWQLLPTNYPHWRTVYGYFVAWHQDGTWRRLHHRLRRWARRLAKRRVRATAGSVDSQSVQRTQMKGPRGFDSGKKITGRKRHLIVDTMGLLLSVVVTPANISDTAGAVLLLPRLRHCAHRLRRVWCDGGYFNAAFEQARRQGIKMEAVLRPEGAKGFVLLPKRWVVERTFAWLSRWRRLAREYEVKPQHSEALIYLAMTKLMLDRLAPL